MSIDIQKRIAKVCALGITVEKNANNPYFNSRYADLPAVVEALKKPLSDAKLSYTFRTTIAPEDGGWILVMNVYALDIDGDGSESLSLSFPITSTDPQKFGAAITYAKRYLLCTAFNVLADEDDDGNSASGKQAVQKKQPSALDIATGVSKSFF